uniref:Uncharacterized protein n=1 Tax=Picea glauca TaxID=3330 RepID=A0A101M4U6_PICGL|nr:hypothetical protein ABT39_MTgene696 [Picea glauca]
MLNPSLINIYISIQESLHLFNPYNCSVHIREIYIRSIITPFREYVLGARILI